MTRAGVFGMPRCCSHFGIAIEVSFDIEKRQAMPFEGR